MLVIYEGMITCAFFDDDEAGHASAKAHLLELGQKYIDNGREEDLVHLNVVEVKGGEDRWHDDGEVVYSYADAKAEQDEAEEEAKEQ